MSRRARYRATGPAPRPPASRRGAAPAPVCSPGSLSSPTPVAYRRSRRTDRAVPDAIARASFPETRARGGRAARSRCHRPARSGRSRARRRRGSGTRARPRARAAAPGSRDSPAPGAGARARSRLAGRPTDPARSRRWRSAGAARRGRRSSPAGRPRPGGSGRSRRGAPASRQRCRRQMSRWNPCEVRFSRRPPGGGASMSSLRSSGLAMSHFTSERDGPLTRAGLHLALRVGDPGPDPALDPRHAGGEHGVASHPVKRPDSRYQ